MPSLIKSHKQLAGLISGKRILHLNSLGKDSVVCLEWLTKYAKPSEIVSIFFEFRASHPDDDRYLNYLKHRYPSVKFITQPNPIELTHQSVGMYQSPVQINTVFNYFEYNEFNLGLMAQDLKKELSCDYICDGSSKYESFARRTKFHQKGLEFKGTIFPLGMMTREQVIGIIRSCSLKLHPCYKFSKGTYDHPSYWKMRSGIIGRSGFWQNLLNVYPLLILDKYRYEVLLK